MEQISKGFAGRAFAYKARAAHNTRDEFIADLGPAELPDRLSWQVAGSLILSLSAALWAGLGLLAARVFG